VGLSLAQKLLLKHGGPRGVRAALSRDEVSRVFTAWKYLARPEQLEPPGDWDTWLILAGRGFGKTRTGAETIQEWVQKGIASRIALVARTAADARDVMVEGESGILAVSRAHGFPARYEPSKRRLTWPNGAVATTFSADVPDLLRGPQHDAAWCDELPAWDDPQATWDQLQFGLRLGRHPRAVVTTTPRPIPIIRAFLKDPRVVVTRGSTYDNAANLAPSFLNAIKRAYEGTRLGRQEIGAEVLEDNPNALWKQDVIDRWRVTAHPELLRIVVAVDPAVSTKPDSDLTGIVVGGVARCRVLPACNGEMHAFVLDDLSNIYKPEAWASQVVGAYRSRRADRVVAEVNNGGDLVEANVRAADKEVSYKSVHASRGKAIRAEPVSALYEQGKVHHVGHFPKLEDEMVQWNPLDGLKSPDRMDANVWLLTELMLEGGLPATIIDHSGDPYNRPNW